VTVITHRNGKNEKLVVNVPSMYRSADLTANLDLENGDTFFVQRAPVFYIYGEVQHAGAYRLEDNLNVLQALSLGGGITARGTERGMKIHRLGADGSLAKIDVQPADKVLPDDVLYIKESLF
jgi:polysaccharide export outer membrane protein